MDFPCIEFRIESCKGEKVTASIYQIQYSDDVVGEFDHEFIKYDCRDFPESERREIAHMQRFYKEERWKKESSEYFGLVSPKFGSKCKLAGADFLNWINDNPGYDVYFINPFPQLQYLHFNVWDQGEYWHPGLLDLADNLFAVAGMDVCTRQLPRNRSDTLLYSNYWVGNQRFWQEFMQFIGNLTCAVDELAEIDRKQLFEKAPHYAEATYFPFIFERMFSTFLILNKNLRCLAYPYEMDEIISRCNNDLEKVILLDWSKLMDEWSSHEKSEEDLRKIFSNVEHIQKLFSAYKAPDISQQSRAVRLKNRFFMLFQRYMNRR